MTWAVCVPKRREGHYVPRVTRSGPQREMKLPHIVPRIVACINTAYASAFLSAPFTPSILGPHPVPSQARLVAAVDISWRAQ